MAVRIRAYQEAAKVPWCTELLLRLFLGLKPIHVEAVRRGVDRHLLSEPGEAAVEGEPLRRFSPVSNHVVPAVLVTSYLAVGRQLHYILKVEESRPQQPELPQRTGFFDPPLATLRILHCSKRTLRAESPLQTVPFASIFRAEL